jgi:hypothetical protein
MQLVKKQLKKHRSGEEHDKLQQLLQRMVREWVLVQVRWFRVPVGQSLTVPTSPVSSGATRDGTAGTQAAAGAALGLEAGAPGSGTAGPSAILPEEM